MVYVGTIRKRKLFADLEKARHYAQAMVNGLSRGEAASLNLTGEQRLSYTRACQLIGEFGGTLDTAAVEYHEAKRLLSSLSK